MIRSQPNLTAFMTYDLQWNLANIQNNAVFWAKCAQCMCLWWYFYWMRTHDEELIKCVKSCAHNALHSYFS